MADVEEIEVVVAHSERATLRVGDVYLKVDADQTRIDAEVEAMALAPVPTPEVLWRKPPAALPAAALGPPRRLRSAARRRMRVARRERRPSRRPDRAQPPGRGGSAPADIDLDVIRAWWSLRSLLVVRWLVEHGFDPSASGCEVDVLKSRL